MIWLKIKAIWTNWVGQPPAPKPAVDEQLTPQAKQELAELVDTLTAQHVRVRDVAQDEPVPEEPQIEEKPLTPSAIDD